MAYYKVCSFLFCAFVMIASAKAQNHCESGEIDSNGGVFPHESDCNAFYMCEWGKPVEFKCPLNLEFNPTTLMCDWPELAGCKKENATVPKNESSNVPEFDRPCENYPEPQCPYHMPNKPAVHLPHPRDCRRFYTCDWEVPYLKDCPAGLHFSQHLQVCDWPERAQCHCGIPAK